MKARQRSLAWPGPESAAWLLAWVLSGCSVYEGELPVDAAAHDARDASPVRDGEATEASPGVDSFVPEVDAELPADAEGGGNDGMVDTGGAFDQRVADVPRSETGLADVDAGGGDDGITEVDAADTGGSDADDVREEIAADVADAADAVDADAVDATADVAGETDVRDASPDVPLDLTADRSPTGGFSVRYKVNDGNATANAIQCEVTILDAGTSTVPLEELSVRYYFTNEVAEPWAVDIGFTGINPGFIDLGPYATKNVVRLTSPTSTADSYVDLGYRAGSPSIGPGQNVVISWQFHSTAYTPMNQTNDYSFDPTKVSAADWERVVLVRSGTVIWGTPP